MMAFANVNMTANIDVVAGEESIYYNFGGGCLRKLPRDVATLKEPHC